MKIVISLIIGMLLGICIGWYFSDRIAMGWTWEPQPKLVVSVEGQSYTLDAGYGYFWSDPVYNTNNTVAFLIKNKGSLRHGYWNISIARVTKSGVTDPVFSNSTLPDETTVMSINRVSDDGRVLLVELHFVTNKEGPNTYYATRPAWLDVEIGKIREIEP